MRFHRTVLLVLVAITALAGVGLTAGSSQTSKPKTRLEQAPILREAGGYTVTARVIEENDKRELRVRVLNNQRLFTGIVHAYFVARDYATLYFEYPDNRAPGDYVLEVPAMNPGTYDLILEITGGNGHRHENPDFVQTFALGVDGRASPEEARLFKRLGFKPVQPDVQPAGKPSRFEFGTLLDGEPIGWGDYYVHQFVLSTNGAFFMHDHPRGVRKLGLGAVESSFTFPKPGQYVVFLFLESGVRVDGKVVKPVLRYPHVFDVQ
jgi:hypothetical protein